MSTLNNNAEEREEAVGQHGETIKVSNSNVILNSLKADDVPTGILHTAMSRNHPLKKYSGEEDSLVISQYRWEHLISELEGYMFNTESPLFTIEKILKSSAVQADEGVIPIFIADIKFNYIGKQMLVKYKDVLGSEISGENKEELIKRLEEDNALLACTLLPHDMEEVKIKPPIRKGLNISYLLKKENYFTNRQKPLDGIEIDFDDGKGFRSINFDEPVSIEYSDDSDKILRYRCRRGGSISKAASKMKFRADANAVPDETLDIQANIRYLDAVNTGKAYILYGSDGKNVKHTSLVNPILITEPFPGNYSFDKWYDTLKGILPMLLSLGFDIVFLSQNAPGDYLQRSAFVAVECIQQINGRRLTGGRFIVMGINMGAVVARYALAYMEKNSLQHKAACYISIDGPHHGMNIPIGVQWMVKALADVVGNSSAEENARTYSSIACRQMLYYYLPGFEYSGSLVTQLHNDFYNELKGMGMPRQTLNIGYSAGLRNGLNTMPYQYRVINWHGNLCVGGEVYSLPNRPGDMEIIANLKYIASEYYYKVKNTVPYDEAPGSMYPAFGALADALSHSGYGDVDNDFPNACLVPTISAIDVNTTADPYTKIPNAVGTDDFSNFDLYIIEPTLLPELSGLTSAESEYSLLKVLMNVNEFENRFKK